MVAPVYTERVPAEDPELNEREQHVHGEKYKIIGVAAAALLGSALLLLQLLGGTARSDQNHFSSFRELLNDREFQETLRSNALSWSIANNASRADVDVAGHLRSFEARSDSHAPVLSRALSTVSLSASERDQTLRALRLLGEPASVAAGRDLHSALSMDGLEEGDASLLANRLLERVRSALRPHSATLRRLRSELRALRNGGVVSSSALRAAVDVDDEAALERLPAVRAVRTRARRASASGQPPLRALQQRRWQPRDAASLVQDQLLLVFDLHAKKFDTALRGLQDDGFNEQPDGSVQGRRLLFDSVYTICADASEDPNGCDFCAVSNGEMPEGCRDDAPNSCACTYGVFANAPKGKIPSDPQQGPVGCDPNCEQVGSFMQCYSGDVNTRAGDGGMSLTTCLSMMVSGYISTPISNLWNDVSDPLWGDHQHAAA